MKKKYVLYANYAPLSLWYVKPDSASFDKNFNRLRYIILNANIMRCDISLSPPPLSLCVSFPVQVLTKIKHVIQMYRTDKSGEIFWKYNLPIIITKFVASKYISLIINIVVSIKIFLLAIFFCKLLNFQNAAHFMKCTDILKLFPCISQHRERKRGGYLIPPFFSSWVAAIN